MRKIITQTGQTVVCLAATSVSIVLSVLITFSILWLTNADNSVTQIALIISIIAPGIIAPLVTWFLIGLIIKIDELEQQQRKLITYDELTGLMSRRTFFEQFDELKQNTERNSNGITLAYIDLDDFKKINDEYGHNAGDQVLETFATTLIKAARNSDIIARIGGEEFAIILPETKIDDAHMILERIRKTVASKRITFEGIDICISMSTGLAHYQGDTLMVDKLVSQADKAMYQAKSEGKNCISLYATR